MPVVCVNRENRTGRRFWTAKKVGQVACLALKEGATRPEIEAEIEKCGKGGRGKKSEAAEALAVAEQALEENQMMLDADAAALQRFLALSQLLAIIARLIISLPNPAAKAVGGSIVVLRELASKRIEQIAVQRASNDAALAIVRRAAANERAFLRSGTSG